MFSIADIDAETKKRLYGAPEVKTVDEARMSSGTPLFTEKDIYDAKNNFLDIMIRSMLVKKNVSREYFNAKCREYYQSLGCLSVQANTNGSNLVRTLILGNLTWNRFTETLSVLGWELSNLTVTVKSSSKADETFGLQEIMDDEAQK